MPNYKITYRNEFEANSPLKAAIDTLRGITEDDALIFIVEDTETGEKWTVDLAEEDEDAVLQMTSEY